MTKVISFHRRKSVSHKPKKSNIKKVNVQAIKNEKYKVILTLVSIVALLIGSLSYRILPDNVINNIITDKIQIFQNADFLCIFFFLIKLDIVFLLLNFFIGTSFLGATLSFLPPFLKCILIGYIGSFFYNVYELKGVLYCLLLLYPYFVVTTSSLIFASNESIYMSNYIFSLVKNKNTADDITARLYLIRYLILLAIDIVCAAVNSGLILVIAPHISLQ